MKISRGRLLTTTLFLLTIFSFTTAFAAKPDVFKFEGDFHYTIPCDGFDLVGDAYEKVSVTTFFDRFGDPDRLQIQVVYRGTLTNPQTGQTLNDPQYAMLKVDLKKGTDTYVGLIYNLTIPGQGVVYQDVGRIVFDTDYNVIFEAGTHEFLNGSDQLICQYFD